MSINAAMTFIERIGVEPELMSRVRAMEPGTPLDCLVRLGAELGLEFDARELRAACLAEWRMRALVHGRHGSSAAGEVEPTAR